MNDCFFRQYDTFYKKLGEYVNMLALDLYNGKVTDSPQEASKIMMDIHNEQLTSKFQGRRYRLTDVAGKVIKPVLA